MVVTSVLKTYNVLRLTYVGTLYKTENKYPPQPRDAEGTINIAQQYHINSCAVASKLHQYDLVLQSGAFNCVSSPSISVVYNKCSNC